MAAVGLLTGLALIFVSVFMMVVAAVGCVKIIQIAEDLRYLRSRSDINVQRPKSWKYIVGMCAVVSAVLVVLAVATVAANAQLFANLASNGAATGIMK